MYLLCKKGPWTPRLTQAIPIVTYIVLSLSIMDWNPHSNKTIHCTMSPHRCTLQILHTQPMVFLLRVHQHRTEIVMWCTLIFGEVRYLYSCKYPKEKYSIDQCMYGRSLHKYILDYWICYVWSIFIFVSEFQYSHSPPLLSPHIFVLYIEAISLFRVPYLIRCHQFHRQMSAICSEFSTCMTVFMTMFELTRLKTKSKYVLYIYRWVSNQWNMASGEIQAIFPPCTCTFTILLYIICFGDLLADSRRNLLTLLFTRGQFWPSGIVVACVCPCGRQSRACPRDNLSLIPARITKFEPDMQNNLVNIPIVLGVDWPWPSRWNLTWKSKFTQFWACPHDHSPPVEVRISKFWPIMHLSSVNIPVNFGIDW